MTEDRRRPPPGKAYVGEAVTVYFDAGRCRHFAECVRGLPEVFDTSVRPWVRPDLAEADAVAEVVRRCPSGALHYVLDGGVTEEPTVPTTVEAVEGGPLVVRGSLSIRTPGGEVAETRAALCRCGDSANEPYCDGACERPAPT